MTNTICTWPSCNHTSRLQCMGPGTPIEVAGEAYHLGLTAEQYDRLEPLLRAEAEASIAANEERNSDAHWRDIFAAEALAALAALPKYMSASSMIVNAAFLADDCYAIADAMILRRARK